MEYGKSKNAKELIEKAESKGILNFLLGSIITSDNTNEEKVYALNLAKEIESCIDETDFPKERKEYVRKFAKDAVELLEKELGESVL